MDRIELIEKLKNIDLHSGDIEADHAAADHALLDFINDEEITELYNKISKWYA